MDRVPPTSPFADVLMRHIDDRYGGNQAALARALGISAQHIGALLSGKIHTPRADLRRRLSRELGLSQLQILVLVGEVDHDDIDAAKLSLPAAVLPIVRLLRDPRLGPAQLGAIEEAVRGAIAVVADDESVARCPDANPSEVAG